MPTRGARDSPSVHPGLELDFDSLTFAYAYNSGSRSCSIELPGQKQNSTRSCAANYQRS